MSVDSRAKGARAEADLVSKLTKATGLNFKRVPSSGALHESHGLKGDLYIPNEKNIYAIEVKHYAESQLDHSLLTSKNPQLLKWWEQAVRQGKQVSREPLLFFKHDRSVWFVAFQYEPEHLDLPRYLIVNALGEEFMITTLDEFLAECNPQFIA